MARSSDLVVLANFSVSMALNMAIIWLALVLRRPSKSAAKKTQWIDRVASSSLSKEPKVRSPKMIPDLANVNRKPLVCSRLDWIHWSENSTSKRVVNCRLSMTFPNLFNYSDGIFQPLWAMMYAPFSNEINWCNHLQSSLLIRKEEFGTELEEIFVSMCLSHRNSRTGVLLLDLTIINWELLDLHKKMWKWAFSFRKNMAIISTSTRLHR